MVASAGQVDDVLKTNTSLDYPDAVRWQHVLAPTFARGINALLVLPNIGGIRMTF